MTAKTKQPIDTKPERSTGLQRVIQPSIAFWQRISPVIRPGIRNQLPLWKPLEHAVFLTLASAAIVLAFLFCFRSERAIWPDEIGLHNAAYAYSTTGVVTYPMYQDIGIHMYIHPPTHYLVSAEVAKILGLPYIPATAVPIFVFTLVIVTALYTGRYEFSVAIAALLAAHMAIYIAGNFTTGRPDEHASVAWIAGLLLIQSAKNRDWSLPRMFLGAAVCTYAGMMHYWATLSFLAVGVYGVYFLVTSKRQQWPKGLVALAAGGLTVGIPYMFFFVIPEYDHIRGITDAVEGSRGWRDSYDKHLLDYRDYFLPQFVKWIPDLSLDGLRPRWLLDALVKRPLELALWLGVPTFAIAIPVLAVHKQTRFMGVGGLGVLLMVLLNASGKNRDYYLPEIFLALLAVLLIVLFGASLLIKLLEPHVRPRLHSFAIRPLLPILAALLGFATLIQVPTSLWQGEWSFTRHQDMIEVNRAAARALVGPNTVHIASIHNWFTSGAEVLWIPRSAVPLGASATEEQVSDFLAPVDYFVETLGIWWLFSPNSFPLNLWYMQGKISLQGFLLDEPYIGQFSQLYFSPNPSPNPPGGFIIGRDSVRRFTPKTGGDAVFEVLACDRYVPPAALPAASFEFSVLTIDGDKGPHLFAMVDKKEQISVAERGLVRAPVTDAFIPGLLERAEKQNKTPEGEPNCAVFQRVEGDLVEVDRDKLLRDSEATDRTIQFTEDRWTAAEQRSVEHGSGPLPPTVLKAVVSPPSAPQLEVAEASASQSSVVLESRECKDCPWIYRSTLKQARFDIPPPPAGVEMCYRASLRGNQRLLTNRPSDPVCFHAYGTSWQLPSIAKTMRPGEISRTELSVTNTGTIVWKQTDPQFAFFAYRWLQGGCNGKAISEATATLTKDVGYQETINLQSDIVAPTKPGKYCLEFDMAHYGNGYFKDFGVQTPKVEVEVR